MTSRNGICRAEPLVALATYLRGQQRWASARVFAERAAQLALSTDQLFVDAADPAFRARYEAIAQEQEAALVDSLDRNARWVAERLDGYQMQTFAYPFGDATLAAKQGLETRAHGRKSFFYSTGLAEGAETLVPMERLSVMGLVEVLGRLRELFAIRDRLIDQLLDLKIDAYIGIDAPDFNLRIAARLKAAGIPVIHYVSPSVWAWRQGRVKGIRASVDLMLCLLPFAVFFVIFQVAPLAWVAINSLNSPTGWGLGNFEKIFASKFYLQAIKHSLEIAFWSSLFGIVIATLGAYSLRQVDSRLRDFVSAFANMTSNFAGVPLAFAFIILLGFNFP